MLESFALLAIAVFFGFRLGRKHYRAEHPKEPPLLHAPSRTAKRKPGYVFILWDKNRPDLVKIVGSTKVLTTPLEKLYALRCQNYEDELGKLYEELKHVRRAGCWYDKDATDMYFDHVAGEV